jgi:two-component system chemotaxis sensor kinase CheA
MSDNAPLDGLLSREELEEIRRTFFDQAASALDVLGDEILSLEGHVPSAARLVPLRRAAHTLKGDCGSVGFPALSSLAHALEDALVGVEALALPLAPHQVDVLLRALDVLREGLEAGAAGRAEPDVDAAVSRLRSLGSRSTQHDSLAGLDEEQRLALRQGRARGLNGVRVAIELRGRVRNRERAIRKVLDHLGLELLGPAVTGKGLSGSHRFQAVALASASASELRMRAVDLRGAAVTVDEIEPEQEAPFPVPSPARAAGLEAARDGETVRVEARRVDEVLDLVGEMVVARSALAQLALELEATLPEEMLGRLGEAQARLGRALQELQRSAMRMRMVPAARVFRHFSRVVRDLARSRGKRVRLEIQGETTELDRGILDALQEPLLHLVRNAVDHGIESPEERRAAGKPEEGRLTLRAGRDANQVVIEVSDDGHGIDAAAVRTRAVEQGLLSSRDAEAMGDEEAFQMIFRAGLSTARELTETSGRGVGLEVVHDSVESLKGSVRAASVAGQGSSFVMRVPLTVAILPALLFRVGGRDLAVPMASVVEIGRRSDLGVQRLGSGEVFRLREEVLDLVPLPSLMGGAPVVGSFPYVIILEGGAGRFGIPADELMGDHELVIKAVHDSWVRASLVAGASVLGGGGLALILDVPAIHRAAAARKTVHHG